MPRHGRRFAGTIDRCDDLLAIGVEHGRCDCRFDVGQAFRRLARFVIQDERPRLLQNVLQNGPTEAQRNVGRCCVAGENLPVAVFAKQDEPTVKPDEIHDGAGRLFVKRVRPRCCLLDVDQRFEPSDQSRAVGDAVELKLARSRRCRNGGRNGPHR